MPWRSPPNVMTDAFLPWTTNDPEPRDNMLVSLAAPSLAPLAKPSLPLLLRWCDRWPALSLRVRCKLRRILLLSGRSPDMAPFCGSSRASDDSPSSAGDDGTRL